MQAETSKLEDLVKKAMVAVKEQQEAQAKKMEDMIAAKDKEREQKAAREAAEAKKKQDEAD